MPNEDPYSQGGHNPVIENAEESARNALADATLTSRISIQKFCCVVSQFSNFKRGLVTETGFGGLMQLKITHKLNLKFSSSLMVTVDPEQSILSLDDSRTIPITDQEINDAFGLPQGSRIIPQGHSELSEVCIEYSRLAANISTKGVHSLKAAEFIVSKQLDENSSRAECECFKIAFVIFSVGHVLNPCAKHDYTSVDYWAALVVPSEINSFNWCRFVKDSLMKGVRKIKLDLLNGNKTIHIVGCHLLLQVIALDNIEISSNQIAQNILPRIKVFDHESVKKAIDSISTHTGHDVLYAGPDEDMDVENVQNSFQESLADNLSQEGSDGASGHEDEAEFDIEEAQREQQMLDTHWKVMEMTFRSEGDAYNFYNKHAQECGFNIRRQKVKRGKGAAGIIRFRRFLCSRAGRRQARFITMEGRTRRLRPETRCDCGAHMVVKYDRQREVWFVGSFVDDHNHAMARPDEVAFLWSHRRIGDGTRAEIMAMQGAGIRKHIMVDNFISRYGSYDKCGLIRRDVYNLCCREKMKLIAKGDAETAVGIMRNRQAKDADFFFEYVLNKEGRLKCMFWCDAQSRRDYQDYGDVVVFDNTYKMNRYGMPFIPFVGVNNHRCTPVFGCAIVSDETEGTYVWLLEAFMRANCQQKPKSVITDGDAAMIRAIRTVLSGVSHRLCSWHIEKNMQKHLHYKSLVDFRSLLYYATSQENFEQRWTAFVNKWMTDKTEEWLNRMYRKRRLWAASYLCDGFFLGMRSNQRSESLNSSLHLHLDYGMTIVDLVVHYENCIVRLHENEAHDDCEANQTVPPTITEYKAIEEHAAAVFSPANFYILQDDLKKMGHLEIFEELLGIESQTFIVTWKDNHKFKYNVLYQPGNSEETISCSCLRMARKGIPCKHILFVLHHLKLSEIPKCCVLHRLTKHARDGLPVQRKSGLFGWGWSGPEERERYSHLSIKSAEAAHVAANDPFFYDELMKCLDKIISKKKVSEEELIGRRRSALLKKQASQAEQGAPGILDPSKVATKGAPKKGKSKGGPDVTKNGRPKDFREKTGRLCNICHLPGHNNATCSQNENNQV